MGNDPILSDSTRGGKLAAGSTKVGVDDDMFRCEIREELYLWILYFVFWMLEAT